MLRQFAVVALAVSVASAQPLAADDALWRDFLAWWRTQPATAEDPRPGYCAKRGWTAMECEGQSAILKRKAQENPQENNAALFDRIYRDPRASFKTTPSRIVVQAIEDVPAGRALDVHMGQGRNAIYLASHGWKVTGFDVSQEGIAAANANARQAGVTIDARREGHDGFDFGESRWDLIVMTYPWLPLADTALFERIVRSVRAGGRIVFEHHRRPSCANAEAGEWVPCANELLRLFSRLRIVFFQETADVPDWSAKKSEIVRLIAVRPAAP